jgi:hypothetical protein
VKNTTRALTCLPPGLFALLLLVSCGMPSQGRPVERNPIGPDPTSRAPVSYYQAQLVELPMRVRSYDLTGPQRRNPVVIRELHLLQDSVRDELLVVDADRGRHHIWSLDAYNFVLHWKTPLEDRVNFDPVATRNYVIFMNSDGQYQAYDRLSMPREGESRLVSRGRYEGDLFPSAPPASNDSHVHVPATNANAMRGLSMLNNARGEGPETWSFPRGGQDVTERFGQIRMRAAVDGETVAFVNNNNVLYMVDGGTGDLRARARLEAHSRTPPLIKDDLVFVGSDIGQIFAWQRSGEAAFIIGLEGLPTGEFFVMDNWILVRTLELFDEEVRARDGSTVLRTATRPGMMHAFKYELIDVPGDRPVFNVIDGDPSRPWQTHPIWSIPDEGQRALTISGDHLFMLYEQTEEFLSERQRARLRSEGRIVRREDEMRTLSRRLRVLDVNTGRLARPEWDMNLADFPFVIGSMQERDRAIYLGTRDGYVFRVFGSDRATGGGR